MSHEQEATNGCVSPAKLSDKAAATTAVESSGEGKDLGHTAGLNDTTVK